MTELRNVDPALRAALDAELAAGERVVWAALPDPAAYARGTGWAAVVFGAVFAGFAVFWMSAALAMGGAWFALFGIPFFVIGVAVMATPLWLRRAARRTVYAVTERRAIVLARAALTGTRTVHSYDPTALGRLTRRERRDGTGDLIFEEHTYRDSDGDARTTRRGFIGLPRVREVEDLVRRTLLTRTPVREDGANDQRRREPD